MSPASDVKKLGWHGARLVITNHEEPEVVILSITEYDAIQQARKKSRRERIIGDRLRALMEKPANAQDQDRRTNP